MKRETVLLPLELPSLTDKGAAQLVRLLHDLVAVIEHHYAAQLHRYHRREQALRQARLPPPSMLDDPPF